MKYDITPLKGAGPFLFGMTANEVRRAAGHRFDSFKRTAAALHPCDYFPELGVFANYTGQGTLDAIEFASPADPLLDGDPLLQLPFDTVKALLQKKDPAVEIEPDTVISHQVGVSVYAPLAKENEKVLSESVLVFAKGYYY